MDKMKPPYYNDVWKKEENITKRKEAEEITYG